jgi:sulfite exporter TauE/SafE
MIRVSAEGFTLGLAMGGSCLVTCLPFLLPYLLGGNITTLAGRTWAFGSFLAGRLAAYLVVGVLSGFLGGFLLAQTGKGAVIVKGCLLVLAGGLLLVFSIRDYKVATGLPCPAGSVKPLKGWPFLTGLVLGFSPCAPFAAGLVKAASLGSPLKGGLFFLFLFLGTTLVLLPAPLLASRMRSLFFRRIGLFFGMVAGAWFLVEGVASWF